MAAETLTLKTEKPVLRGPGGRFLPGTRGGPGRKPLARESEYLRAMAETCGVEEWRKIVAKAVQQAKDGDAQARTWLARYLLGEPKADAPRLRDIARQDADSQEDQGGRDELPSAAALREIVEGLEDLSRQWAEAADPIRSMRQALAREFGTPAPEAAEKLGNCPGS